MKTRQKVWREKLYQKLKEKPGRYSYKTLRRMTGMDVYHMVSKLLEEYEDIEIIKGVSKPYEEGICICSYERT